MRTGHKVFVNNIDLKATRQEVHDFFSRYGQVANVRFLMDKNQFRGKAVVLFSQNEAAEATIQHRRKKEINRCHAHDDYKLAVFNLPKDITDQDLQKLFAGFGKLRTAKIMQRD